MARIPFDNDAELSRRTGRGERPPLTKNHRIVEYAVALARLSAYCQELRPFGRWVISALRHGRRAGRMPEPPTLNRQLVQLPTVGVLADLARKGGWASVDAVTRAVHVAGRDQGVRSSAFAAAAEEFIIYWNLLVGGHLISYDPRKREPDPLRRAFVIALVQWLPDYRLGPAQLALLAAVVGIDQPIVRTSEGDSVADAVARRASRYDRFWKLARKAQPALRAAARRLKTSGNTPKTRSTSRTRRR